MQRIAVIGSPGTGKTTFSKKLAVQLDLPLYHLDFYYWDDSFKYAEDRLAWRKKVAELANQHKWIIDGNNKSTYDVRFPRADTIIYLDYSRNVSLRRAVHRRVKLNGKVRDDMPPNWKEKFSFSLLKFIWTYNTVQRPKVYELLAAQKGKNIIILRNSQQADTYLSGLR